MASRVQLGLVRAMSPNMHMIGEEQGPLECPRCSGDAVWRFLDEEKSLVEVHCANCGRLEKSRAEFEKAEADAVEANECD